MNKRGINYTVLFFLLIPFLKRHLQKAFILRYALIGSLSGMIKHISEAEMRHFGLGQITELKEREETQLKQVAPGLSRITVMEPIVLFSEQTPPSLTSLFLLMDPESFHLLGFKH